MRTIKMTSEFRAPIAKVWEAFVNPRVISQWGAGPATMNANVGTDFSLWGGDIWGTNIEVVPREHLVQEWYAGKWPRPSRVTFSFTEHDDVTTVALLHTDIPDEEFEDIHAGWAEYYFNPMRVLLEGNHTS